MSWCGALRMWSVVHLAAVVLGIGCGVIDPCENSQQSRVPSPDEEVAAWVFIRDCGATTAKSVQVSVVPASDGAPSEAGNTFIIGGESTVVAEWQAAGQLVISYEPLAEIFKREVRVGEVEVSYRER